MKLLKTFESFTYNKDEDDYSSNWYNHVVDTLNTEFGEKIQGKSADWGGLTLWPLQNDEFIGYFIVMNDENNISYLKRTYDADGIYIDIDYLYVEEGDDITELVNMVKKQYIQNKYKI